MSDEFIQVEDFNINDPALDTFVPDLNPEALPEQLRPAPIDDGVHWLIVKADSKRQGGPIYFKDVVKNKKGEIVDGKVVAALEVRVEKEDGTPGGYLKTFYASTTPQGRNRGSSLTYILAQAKDPVRGGSGIKAIYQHAERVLAENAEKGIRILAKTRWVKSVPQTEDSTGTPLYVFVNNQKVYTEVKGQEKIIELAIRQATEEAAYFTPAEGETAEEFQLRKEDHIAGAPSRAHIWYDVVSGDERTVSAEIQSLENPAMYVSA